MELPMCNACKHPHEQGVACSVCGHKGRSTIYQRMVAHSEAASRFSVLHFDAQSRNLSSVDYQFNVNAMLRAQAYGEEGVTSRVEEESRAIHATGMLGDLPVAVARWRLVQLPGTFVTRSHAIAVVDRLAVLPNYRQRGFGVHLLREVYNNIMSRREETGVLQGIFLVVSSQVAQWAVPRLLQQGLEIVADVGPEVSSSMEMNSTCLVLPPSRIGTTPAI